MFEDKPFQWNPEKNLQLQQQRGINFEMVVQSIKEKKFLDEEEQEILDFVEKGEWESIPNLEEEMNRLQQSAQAFLAKKNGCPVVITYDELIAAQEILTAQLRDSDSFPAQTIKSLLDKIEVAIESY